MVMTRSGAYSQPHDDCSTTTLCRLWKACAEWSLLHCPRELGRRHLERVVHVGVGPSALFRAGGRLPAYRAGRAAPVQR